MQLDQGRNLALVVIGNVALLATMEGLMAHITKRRPWARPEQAVTPESLAMDRRQWLKRAFGGAVGAGLMVAGAAGGKVAGRVLAPAMARIVRQSFSRVAARTGAQLASRATTTSAGASVGSAVPVVGSAVGAALGFAAGAALDYMGNRVDKWLNREQFIAENLQALDAIEREWRRTLERELHRAIDVWYDDAETLLRQLRPETT